jgi:hypothetical protein
MAQRIVRNSFVAGEISPELWGRHDVEMYHHAAARIENFIPRRTGGLRKRAGTELVWHIAGSAGEARDYRLVPYRYDKDACGILALYRKGTGTQVFWRFWSSASGTATNEAAVPFLSVTRSVPLSAIRHEQIGDTVFFTLTGTRAFTAKVTFSAGTVHWEQLHTEIAVSDPPALSTTASGFGSGDNYVAGYREYALWGVKDGIRSAIRTRRQTITLAWAAGAFVDVSFTPDWGHHDYYILGKLQGGQYGEVARYYPDLDNGSRADIRNYYGGSQSATGTIDGVTHTAALSSVATAWKTTDADAIGANGRHACGSWVSSIGAQHNVATAKVLSLKVWFGAKMTHEETDPDTNATSTVVSNVGYPDAVHAVLYKTNGSGDIIAEWDVTPGYNEVPTKLDILAPVANAGGYALHFFTDGTRTTSVAVPMRGLVLCTDMASRTFHDDNISPGSLVGEQDLLKVGASGMDVNLVTTWQQRLVAAGSAEMPFTLWFSAAGDLYNFYVDRPQVSDNAFEATIASTEANRIIHIVAQKWLLAFTESGEYTIGAANGTLAYNTIDIKRISGVGAHDGIPPVTTESEVLFVAHDGRSVYKMDYTLERDSVVPTDLSLRAEHIAAKAGIAAIAWQRYPDSVLWCLLADGSLASITFCPEESVCAWARHTLAGGDGLKAVDIFGSGSVSSATGTATTSDIFLVLVHPDRPGDVWVERLRPCVNVDEPPMDAATCADHLGYDATDFPAGEDPRGTVEASFETIRFEPPQADTIGKAAAQYEATLRILRSGIVAARPVSEPDAREAEWRSTAFQSRKTPVETGGTVLLVRSDVRISPQVVHNREGRFEIRSADQWPCDILALCLLGNFGTMKEGG